VTINGTYSWRHHFYDAEKGGEKFSLRSLYSSSRKLTERVPPARGAWIEVAGLGQDLGAYVPLVHGVLAVEAVAASIILIPK
jgi:hypothetical protein